MLIGAEHGEGRVRERKTSAGSSADEDSDNDELLAAAAAAVEAQVMHVFTHYLCFLLVPALGKPGLPSE